MAPLALFSQDISPLVGIISSFSLLLKFFSFSLPIKPTLSFSLSYCPHLSFLLYKSRRGTNFSTPSNKSRRGPNPSAAILFFSYFYTPSTFFLEILVPSLPAILLLSARRKTKGFKEVHHHRT